MDKVSVIIPVYNLENLIERCLNSVINQTYSNVEIILIDDGSVDESAAIIKRLKKNNKNIIYKYKNNGGQASARNLGLKICTGKYVMFVDGDDWIEKDMIEEMMSCFSDDNYDLVICDFYKDYQSGSVYGHTIEHNYENEKTNLILSRPGPCFKIYRKSFFGDNFFLENVIFEDLAIIPYINSLVKKYHYIKKAFYHYYIRDNSTMQATSFSNKEYDVFSALDHLSNKISDEFNCELEYLHIMHLLYSSYLRVIKHKLKETREIRKRISDVMKEKYPNWRHNRYYKDNNFKNKVIINLAYLNLGFVLKTLLIIRKKHENYS